MDVLRSLRTIASARDELCIEVQVVRFEGSCFLICTGVVSGEGGCSVIHVVSVIHGFTVFTVRMGRIKAYNSMLVLANYKAMVSFRRLGPPCI